VVNLDADNIVFLGGKNIQNIEIYNGCLEYEKPEYKILDLVAENIDGGYDAIERRINFYNERD